MQNKVRFGILGFGKHAQSIQAAFSETSACELVDRSSSRDDYSRLVQNHAVEVVYICLANHLHATWTEAALEAGKHVLCEKPFALSFSETEHISETAKRLNRRIFEAFMYRFHPQHQLVKQLLAENRIGTVQNFEAHYEYFLDDPTNIRLQPSSGGGALLDAGCYGIDCANFLLGKQPTTIQGDWAVDEDLRVDRQVALTFMYDSGLQAKIFAANNAPRANWYRLQGTKGAIVVPSAFHVPRMKQTTVELHWPGKSKEIIPLPAANHFALQFDAVAAAVRGVRSDKGDFPDILGNACLLELSAMACKTGKPLHASEVRCSPKTLRVPVSAQTE